MSAQERREFLKQPFLLPADVLVFPVTELAEHVRQSLEFEAGDYAVTRPNMRSFSRIVNEETAALLQEFRQPSTITEAIIRYSKRKGYDPYELLESSFPVLQTFSEAAFLVPADSPLAEGVRASFAPGQVVAQYEIRRLIQSLEDTEIYQVIDGDGRVLALKISRPSPSFSLLLAMTREAEILEHLDGRPSPRLIEHGLEDERVFLATEWLSGVPINRRARELRSGHSATWRNDLHRLCGRLLDAYVVLHENGVIHGDVHTQNALIDGQNAISILDFGLARLPQNADLEHNQRSGMAWFMDPQLARAILENETLPKATFLGEQYAVAALIYTLICGSNYLTATPEREVLYRQILQTSLPPFTRYGFESWPEVESVLARALAKEPEERYDSMAEFGEAFWHSGPPKVRAPGVKDKLLKGRRQRWVEDLIARASIKPKAYDQLFPQPPRSSLYFGAAGLVWFLYRCAQLREDPGLLAAADLWARQASQQMDRRGSFGTPAQQNEESQEQFASLYLGRSGLAFVSALVNHARGDMRSCGEQLQQFIETSSMQNDRQELLFGQGGLLIGASRLLEAFEWSGRLDTEPLRHFLQELSSPLLRAITQQAESLNQEWLPHLGMAHGWAGILFALLTAQRALQTSPPAIIKERLDQLAGKAEPFGRGVSWLGTLQHPDQTSEMPAHAPGWCSGSAGHVFLWTLAAEIFFDEAYERLANQAAWTTWEHPDSNANLCCGLSGRAFALLRFYRHSGDRDWLMRAEALAKRALATFMDRPNGQERAFSLYRGALGPALLALELQWPERSAMAVLDEEGWPAAGETTHKH